MDFEKASTQGICLILMDMQGALVSLCVRVCAKKKR